MAVYLPNFGHGLFKLAASAHLADFDQFMAVSVLVRLTPRRR